MRRRASADSSLSVSSTASRTKPFVAASPHACSARSPKPPAKPLVPTKPIPEISTAVPSRTVTCAPARISVTWAAASDSKSWLPRTATFGIFTAWSSFARICASSGRPRSVRSPHSASTSAFSATREKRAFNAPGEVRLQWRSPTAATRTEPFTVLAPGRVFDCAEQLSEVRGVERLDQMMVEAGRPGPSAIGLVAPSGDGDEAHARAPGLATDPLCDLVAVELGQTDVEQHDLGTELAGHLQRFEPVVRGA